MGTLWVDVTTLLNWNGRPTGIPRVIACLVRDWLEAGEMKIAFCRFDPELQGFVNVPRESLRGLELLQAPATENHPAPATGELDMSFKARLRRKLRAELKKLYQKLPGDLQPLAKDFGHDTLRWIGTFKFLLKATFRALRRWGPVRKFRLSLGKRGSLLSFAPDDVLYSAGASWSEANYMERVWLLKKERGFRVATFVYDLIPCKFPHFFGSGFGKSYQGWTVNMLWCSDFIQTISKNSRKDIIEFAGIAGAPCPPVEVIRLGDDIAGKGSRPSWLKETGLGDGVPFVLTVGTVEVRKNHLILYQAWKKLVAASGGKAVPKLLIAGRPGWSVNDVLYQMTHDPEVQDHVAFARYASDSDLAWLYENCLFTVYPSHYEGWGLPIAESLMHGKLCIASSTSSMPEIAGDLVPYHDPSDLAGLVGLLSKAIHEPSFTKEHEARIRAGYKPTTWRQCANQTAEGLLKRFPELKGGAR